MVMLLTNPSAYLIRPETQPSNLQVLKQDNVGKGAYAEGVYAESACAERTYAGRAYAHRAYAPRVYAERALSTLWAHVSCGLAVREELLTLWANSL
jgi:hypothetical protein